MSSDASQERRCRGRWFSAGRPGLPVSLPALVLSLLVLPAAALAQGHGAAHGRAKLDRALLARVEASQAGPVRIIVQVRPGSSDAIGEQLTKHGHVHTAHAPGHALTATVSTDALDALTAHPDVEHISVDALVQAFSSSHEAVLQGTLGLPLPDSSLTGANVGIVVIDSGIEHNRDFSFLMESYDFTGGRSARVKPADPYGHGTHIAGLMAANGSLSDGLYRGVAPGARLFSLRVLDEMGRGFTSDVIRAIDFAVANRVSLDLHVINLSLGHPIYEPAATDPLVRAVERASQAGLAVVVAAGNFGRSPTTGEIGYSGITSPGNAPSAITVGAFDMKCTITRADDAVAPYSSRGPTWYDAFAKPDVVAPGHRLVSNAALRSTLYRDHPALQVPGNGKQPLHLRLSGTSMATAVTSGTVALMVQAHRDQFFKNANHYRPLPVNALKAILQHTALLMEGYDHLTQGTGGVNPAGAVELAGSINTRAQPGRYWLTRSSSESSVIGGQSLVWSSSLIWGTSLIGGHAIYYHEPAWASDVTWGAATLSSGQSLVWGNVVWDQPEVWAHTLVWGNSMVWGHLSSSGLVWGHLTEAAGATDDAGAVNLEEAR